MSPNKRNLRLDKVCRACLTECGTLRPIFESRVFEMMMACAKIQISQNDGLPEHVCTACYKQINQCFKFKKKLERSDVSLRGRLKELKMANIIAQAANDADIELTPVTIKTDNNYENTEQSDDDEPLAVRQARMATKSKRPPRQSKIKANKIIDNVIKNESLKEYSDIIADVMKDDEDLVGNLEFSEVQSLQTAIFTDGPPPLVPLAPIHNASMNIISEFIEAPPDLSSIKPIPDNAPPLIPIKPVSIFDQITALDPAIQQLTLQCSTCSEDFTDVTELKNHMTTCHHSATGNNLICNICKKEFADKKRLIGHLKGHMVIKHYACKLCGKRYPNPSTFEVHMRTHTGERPFKCQICGKGFVRWAGVIGHMKSHNSYTPYKCDICQKGFKINSNLERHKILHTGEMPFCCSYCGKTFSQSDNLQLHVRTYHTHERPYLCSECGKGFVSATRLNRHMWVHTGFKPYHCKTCHKAYSNSNDLKNHERTHFGGLKDSDKPHACTQCSMRFFHPCRLAKHMKTHEKPYACMGCPKTFSKQNVLNRHVLNKHNEEEQMESFI